MRPVVRQGLLISIITAILPIWASAQSVKNLTDEQIRQFVQQAQASGMTDAQMQEMALARGFTSTDIRAMRERIGQLQGPATKPLVTAMMPSAVPGTEPPFREPPFREPPFREPPFREQPPTPAPPTPVAETGPLVFGASLFANASLSFEPNLRIPTPRHYVIGPDDELIVDIYGNAQQTYRPRVSPEGSIRLENLSPVYVNGLTIEQAEQRVVSRLRTLYRGLNQVGSGISGQLTLGSVRSMRVTLLGQVVRPGTYTLSSLATLFNALYASGGPRPDRGSFRTIRLYRANRLVRTLDCYDFLLRADQKDNVRLQDQDIVFVDHHAGRIELTGDVKQPGLYEIQAGETLGQVLHFAGDFTDRAYTASLTLRRNTATGRQLITVTKAELAQFIPQAGDQYVIGTLLDRLENRVSIGGAVFRPGAYALEKSRTLRQLIGSAEGLREDAFLSRATIRRLRENLDPELISVDLGRILRNEQTDMLLQRDDSVHISRVGDLRQLRNVTIQGAVNRAGTFAFADSMTIASLVVLAGGFSEAAVSSRLEIARRVKNDTTNLPTGQTIRLLTAAINADLRLDPADARLILQPFDQVFVRTSPHYEAQKGVSVAGEVQFPGTYAIRAKTDRIADLIGRAGGLKNGAYLPAARFVRQGEDVSLNLDDALQNPATAGNILLEDGDVLTIPRRAELIRIRGEVLNPATVEFEPGKSFRAYIDDAGGFRPKAQRRKAYAVAANGKIQPTRTFLFVRRYPKPSRGMEIVVPSEPVNNSPRPSTTERAALLTVIASGAAVILSALRLFTG